MLNQGRWARRVAGLDADHDYPEIVRILYSLEFPWDVVQAESLALLRTFAVPSIGCLLARTGEFTGRTQRRYDDTALILAAVYEDGFDSEEGRTATRRMNQMHRRHNISNEDFLYVLATLAVGPKRWLEQYGRRRHTPHELRAVTNYYRELGRRMNLKDIPASMAEFEAYLDVYEDEHFAFDPGGRAVADATLDLFAGWYPKPVRRLVRAASIALLDPKLREALHYPAPPAVLRTAARAALRTRAYALRLAPPRRRASRVRDLPQVRSYPNGFDFAALGTFDGDH